MRQQARQDPVAFQRAVERIARMEGVRGVSTYTIEAMGPAVLSSDADAAQQPYFGTGTYHRVGWNFLRTLGVSVIQGRDFEPGDDLGAAPVAIVDEATARALWPGMDPVGHLVKVSKARDSGDWIRIIGVSRHATLTSMLNSIDFLEMAVVFVVQPQAARNGQIVARVDGDPTVARERMNQVLREELPSNMFTTGFQSWLLQWQRQVDGRLTLAGLFAVFGLLAVGLGGIGLYGVLAYAVGQRMREFAVRVALGAVPRDLQRLVLRDGAIMILGGTAAGAFLGMAGSRLLDFWLFDVAPTDVVSLVSAEAALLLAAFAACIAPARRAAKADPVQIIRAL